MRALIVEQGNSRGAVTAARSLRRAGWEVGVGSPGGEGLVSRSVACTSRHAIAAAHEGLQRFVHEVCAVVERHRYDVVFGSGEAEVLALSLSRENIPALVPYGPHGSLEQALDKLELDRAAEAAGLSIARPLGISDVRDDQRVVVKARRHARPEVPGAPPRVDTNVVVGRDAVSQRIHRLSELGAEPLLYEFVEGPLLAYACVISSQNGVVADCMQVAERIWPPLAGASSRATTIEVESELAEGCRRLLEDLEWFGLAELQFVVPADGTPRLIDLNGRFYGSLALAVAAGADLPAAWAAIALGEPFPFVRAEAGVHYQWLEGDLKRAWAERRGGAVRDLSATIMRAPRAHHSLFEPRDPGPAVARLTQLLLRRAG